MGEVRVETERCFLVASDLLTSLKPMERGNVNTSLRALWPRVLARTLNCIDEPNTMILPVASEVTMKQKLFVLGGSPIQLEDIRRRFSEAFDIIVCQSISEVQRNLEIHAHGAVLPLGMNGGSHNGVVVAQDVDRLIESIVRTGSTEEKPMPKTLADRVDLLEQKIIESTLTRNRHHRKDTAAELGISRVTLYNKMKKFGMLN